LIDTTMTLLFLASEVPLMKALDPSTNPPPWIAKITGKGVVEAASGR